MLRCNNKFATWNSVYNYNNLKKDTQNHISVLKCGDLGNGKSWGLCPQTWG